MGIVAMGCMAIGADGCPVVGFIWIVKNILYGSSTVALIQDTRAKVLISRPIASIAEFLAFDIEGLHFELQQVRVEGTPRFLIIFSGEIRQDEQIGVGLLSCNGDMAGRTDVFHADLLDVIDMGNIIVVWSQLQGEGAPGVRKHLDIVKEAIEHFDPD